MVWGCMTPQGVGYICKIDGRMDDEFLETIEVYGVGQGGPHLPTG